ncbi:hypothetical protein C8J57DRAFT_1611073 [Mycena rebaudengoi]|nr:hypothetical protein C8J57DRAFT_1611073 [Mycena rebaudengoi]
MQIPRELVDAIIDKVAIFDEDGVLDPSSQRALWACSLTARSFLPRSQLHLFAVIGCRRYRSDFTEFEALLAGVQLRAQSHEKAVVVPRILRLLPGLTHLVLEGLDDPVDDGHVWASQPDLLKASLHATSSRHCLRSLCLTDLSFANVSELETLLSHGIGLKELILDNIRFKSSVHGQRIDGPRKPRVVIAL